MVDNYQAPPPSYTEVTGPYFTPEGAQPHAQAQQQYSGAVKYPTVTPNIPTAYGIQTINVPLFQKNPVQCICPHCRSMIVTRVEENAGVLAWIVCLVLVLFGCWLGCCLIPFCISDLQNIKHFCPNCRAFLGEYAPV